MAKHNERDRTGRFIPKPVLPEFDEEARQVVEPQLPEPKFPTMTLNDEFAHGTGVRKAILIDATSGLKLDSGIVQVTQPDQVNGGSVPPRLKYVSDSRLMAKQHFGHLDNDGDDI
jgi:hypothetical protein